MPMNKNSSKIVKVKNIRSGGIYYTSPRWDIKTIDGVEFLQVKVSETDKNFYLMRKEGLEFIK